MRIFGNAVALGAALLIAGCRAAPIYNAEDVSYASPRVSTAQTLDQSDYQDAIVRAGARRGWTFREEGPGHLAGSVAVRNKHFATVDVYFDRDKFSIVYRSSQNLNYDPTLKEIHPNYNSWVSLLEQDIQKEITLMQADS